jgi:hypothetical protein
VRARISCTILAWVASAGCADPVHDNQVAALGNEDPNVAPGPLHRPGQPCLACHGGSGPANTQFTIGGTVYALKGQSQPFAGVVVELVDSNQSTWNVPTNQVGNFWVSVDEWSPAFPVHASLGLQNGHVVAVMQSHMGRDGSCADCHYDPPSPYTPGRVYLAIDPADLPDGGGP